MKTDSAVVTIWLFISLLNFNLLAQKLPVDVEEAVKKRVAYGKSPSFAIGIVDKDGARYFNFGTTILDGAPVDEHTIYEIGSITKVFTATLLAQNVVDGKMKLDDPIKNYLPKNVKVPERGANAITLGNLSDHTSGLPRMPNNFNPSNPANPYADYSLDQLYSFLSNYELTRNIGDEFEYSNLAQGLLGQILAQYAGTSYEDLMLKTIALPLNMQETKIKFSAQMKKNLAYGYNGIEQVENWDSQALEGAGAIRSSTSDMLKFLSANLALTKTPLRKAMDLTQQTRHEKARNGKLRVGLAWLIEKSDIGDVFWHNGGTGGYRAFVGFAKEKGMGVVVLTNSDFGVDDLGFHLLNADRPLAQVKPNMATELNKIISKKGVTEAEIFFRYVYSPKPEEYDFVEDEINSLGYKYLTNNNVLAALTIFKINAAHFPNSWNAYDSYAEALLKNGQKELSIESYKKSLELNPKNTNAIEVLKKLGVVLGRD
ncbi:MAG TPA: serine hydrolase [Cyclobacteriaceae bacterium]|jgi:CubicO group peptidase (beta-lactamase class C family)|nr:serine hydrolase [Cyclobacteriaceae bacterium]